MAYLCGHNDQALSNFESSTTIWRTLADGGSRGSEMALFLNLQFFAMFSMGSGNVDRAFALANEEAETIRRFPDVGGDKIQRFFMNNILTLTSLACCLAARGNYAEAECLATQADIVGSGIADAEGIEELDRLLGNLRLRENLRRILDASDEDDRNYEVANLRSLCDEITVPIKRQFPKMLERLTGAM